MKDKESRLESSIDCVVVCVYERCLLFISNFCPELNVVYFKFMS